METKGKHGVIMGELTREDLFRMVADLERKGELTEEDIAEMKANPEQLNDRQKNFWIAEGAYRALEILGMDMEYICWECEER